MLRPSTTPDILVIFNLIHWKIWCYPILQLPQISQYVRHFLRDTEHDKEVGET